MKYIILFSIFFFSVSAPTQAQIAKGHPCFKSNESNECLDKVRSSIFFATSVDGTQRSEYTNFLHSYFNKYGIEGFYKPESQYRSTSLLIYAINSSGLSSLNKKLISSIPKGKIVDGANIFGMVIRDTPPFTRKAGLKAYVDNLKQLFPIEGNENFKITNERFGLPWDDGNFVQEYVNRMKEAVKRIDDHNRIFKKSDFQDIKKEIEGFISRISVLGEIPKKICAIDSYDEFKETERLYGEIIKSRNTDIISCLIENKKFDLVEKIVSNHEYDIHKLPSYFDKVAGMKGSAESFKLGQTLFLKMAQNDQKVNLVKGEKQRDFLQKSSLYLNKYDLENMICELKPGEGTTVSDLSIDLEKMLYVEAYQLMEEILAEKDKAKKETLLEQFIQLTAVGLNLAKLNPLSGKTIMHLIAEAGDIDVINSLNSRKMSLMSIGDRVQDKNGDSPLESAIKICSKKTLIVAQNLFQNAHYYDYEDLKDLKKKVHKSKAVDEESKAQRKIFIDAISVAISRTY